MSRMSNAIERGASNAIAKLLNGDVENGGFGELVASAVMKEELLSSKVLVLLNAEFHRRLKRGLVNLGEAICSGGRGKPAYILPDCIAEWVEELERISTALYDFTQNKDVLEGLRFISMSGREWSDYTEGCEEDPGVPFTLEEKPTTPQVIIKMQNGVPKLVRKPHDVTVGIVGYDLAGNRMAPLWLEAEDSDGN